MYAVISGGRNIDNPLVCLLYVCMPINFSLGNQAKSVPWIEKRTEFQLFLLCQIQDAIKRSREIGNLGGDSRNPNTKPSPIQNAKHATNLPGKGI